MSDAINEITRLRKLLDGQAVSTVYVKAQNDDWLKQERVVPSRRGGTAKARA